MITVEEEITITMSSQLSSSKDSVSSYRSEEEFLDDNSEENIEVDHS
jgi:hypothetical protein